MATAFVYTRTSVLTTRSKQKAEIMAQFEGQINEYSVVVSVDETRLKTVKLSSMIDELRPMDIVFCYTPSVFGVGVENCAEFLQTIMDKGVLIMSCLYGLITREFVKNLRASGEIVRECFEVECDELNHSARGAIAHKGGFFKNGVWQQGRRRHIRPPVWAFNGPKAMTDNCIVDNETSPARLWIEARILQGAKTETIWKEYRLLCKVLPEEQWERLAKTWITARRCQILK